jgi:hypothetical protein
MLPAPANAPFDPADRLRAGCAFQGAGAEISDHEPAFTALVRDVLADGRTGESVPSRFAPELRPRLVLFFKTYGVRILPPLGSLKSLTLVGEATVGGKRLRRYRAEFENGRMTLVVGMAADGTISSMDLSRG